MPVPTEKELMRLSTARRTGYVVPVTPALAKQWLATNIGNRAWRKGHSETLAQAMRNGSWKWTHQGIAFSANRLVDGQHRLQAVMISGCTVLMLVFPSMNDVSFGILDRGKNRSNKDDISLDGQLVEAVSFLLRIGATSRNGTAAISAHAAKLAADSLEESFSALTAASNKNVKARTAAPMRAAALLRHFAASDAQKVEIEKQWAAWCNLDVKQMNNSTAALLKRLENSTVTSDGGSRQNERGACAWLGFDPANPDRKIIKIDDLSKLLNQMKETLNDAIEQHTASMWEPA